MKTIFKSYSVLVVTIALVTASSCKKLVDVKSTTIVTSEISYSDSVMTVSNVNGIYFSMQQQGTFYNASYFGSFPLLSDEAEIGTTYSAANFEFAENRLSTTNSFAYGMWQNGFKTIFQANSVIENIPSVGFLSESTKKQLLGEAKFLRAYSYFVLSQHFGALPLVTGTDYIVNSSLSRSDTAIINKFVLDELTEAESMLSSGYAGFQNQRIRVCKEVAQAFLARMHLYRGDWQNAELYATKVIDNPLFTLEPLADVFSKNSRETIWKLWMTTYQNFTAAVLVPYLLDGPSKPEVVPSPILINALEPDDSRRDAYFYYSTGTNSNYSYKYRDLISYADNPVLFRLAEIYLIRAEARARQNNLSGNESTASDISMLRNRAGLSEISITSKEEALNAIMKERLIELSFEGHRWLDLIRTGQLDHALSTFKPATWTVASPRLLPVPANEIALNTNLLPQNPGY